MSLTTVIIAAVAGLVVGALVVYLIVVTVVSNFMFTTAIL